MPLTRSFGRLSLANAASCAHCGKGFPPGSLDAKEAQEDKALDQIVAFLVLPLVFPSPLSNRDASRVQ